MYKSREKHNQFHLNRYHSKRATGIDILGGHCSQCGRQTLEFDHIDPVTKSFNLNVQWGRADWFEELAKCQLLCHDCHKLKSDAESLRDIHGTWAQYRKRKCRCEACRAFVNNYMKAYKARKQ